MGKEQRLIPGDEFSSEHWDTGYWISESDIIDMLHILHKFNLLTQKSLNLMSSQLSINLMELCEKNGITYTIPNKEILCPKCQSNIVGTIGAVISNEKASSNYRICNICGHKW